MTREDAIRTLKEHKIMFQHDFGWDRSTLEALDTAIEALSAIEQIRWERDIAIEQLKELGYELSEKIRTSEDCINRAEARRLIVETDRIGGVSCGAFKTLYNGIDELSPVTPKQKMYFDGMTNGEVIKTLFPSCKTRRENTPMDNFMEFTLDGIVGYAIEKSWWNAPYKESEEV